MCRISYNTQPLEADVMGSGRWSLTPTTPHDVRLAEGAVAELVIEN